MAILVGLGVAEVALRLAGFGENTVYLHAGMLRHHPTLGWEKKPSAKAVYEFEGSTIVETSNRDGFRGPLHSSEKSPGEFRVLALGDSFCEGYLVNDNEVFSAVLERQWKNRRRLSVLNAGVAGYSTDQELIYFRAAGAKYQPDVTLVLFFDNDVWFNTQVDEYRSKKPRFALSGGGLVLEGVPVPSPPSNAASARRESRGFLRDHFRVAQLVAERAARLIWWRTEREDLPVVEEHGVVPAAHVNLPGEFNLYRRDQPESIREAWRLTEAILGEFSREAEAAGGRLAVFYVPTVAAIYPEAWQATKRRWGLNDEQWSIEQVEPMLREVCRRQGIDFIPATAELRNAAKRPELSSKRLYYMKDGHWNAAGHAAAAEILENYLAKLVD